MKSQLHRNAPTNSRGFSLIELLVAVAINLVIVVAAANLYLGSRESQRVLTEKSNMFEAGTFALELIGRELENAGYYPAMTPNSAGQSLTIGGYDKTITPHAAFQAGLFGCDAQKFLPNQSTPGCGTHPGAPAATADTLVINYFTNDALSLDIGQRADCQFQNVANNPVNTLRAGANTAHTGLAPVLPLFVSNRYTLTPTTVQIEGQTISTFSLACNGSGAATATNTYQPMLTGIEQLRFRYGAFASEVGMQADQFFNSAQVNALTPVPLANTTREKWERVVAVRACLLVRSMQRARSEGGQSYTLTDCDGTAVTYTDGVDRRVYTQVFAVKNNVPQTYPIN